jgi:hypothetical protein
MENGIRDPGVMGNVMLARKGNKGMGCGLLERDDGLGFPFNHFRHLRSNLGDGLS